MTVMTPSLQIRAGISPWSPQHAGESSTGEGLEPRRGAVQVMAAPACFELDGCDSRPPALAMPHCVVSSTGLSPPLAVSLVEVAIASRPPADDHKLTVCRRVFRGPW